MTTAKKILMLHGFVQSDRIFRQKTGGLRKSLQKMGYELFYPCGPEKVDKSTLSHGNVDKETDKKDIQKQFNTTLDDESSDLYGWWVRTASGEKGTLEYTIPQSTLDFLHNYIVENGPFEGIIGFSQGAGLGGYLARDINRILDLTPTQQQPLKFFISFSGFKLEPPQYQSAYDIDNDETPKSLHIQGELDAVVSEARVMKLYESYPESKRTLLKHPGSHFVPNSKPFVSQVCNWLHHVEQTENDTSQDETSTENSKSSEAIIDDDLLAMMDSMGKL
ncbi:family of serine hydrolases 3 [Monosporozyma servazzii]